MRRGLSIITFGDKTDRFQRLYHPVTRRGESTSCETVVIMNALHSVRLVSFHFDDFPADPPAAAGMPIRSCACPLTILMTAEE
jgi:hypothetical protein